MKLNITSQKLVNEMKRIMQEQARTSCNVKTLIDSLFDFRDAENDFANLFYIYFERNLKIKIDVIDSAIFQLNNETEIGGTSTKFVFETCEGNAIDIEIDEELEKVIYSVNNILIENEKEYVIPDYFVVALFESESQTMRRFLKKINANYMEAKAFFKREKIFGYEIVPYELSSFVWYRNPDYKGIDCDIVGREEEIKEIYRIMLKSSKRNVIIYGDAGVGKTAVGEKFIYEIANGLCPLRFANFKVLEMSVRHFILNCENSRQANEKMNSLLDFLSKQKDDIVLLIDEIQTILGKCGFFDSKKLDLSTTLKPILARSDLRIIGITTAIDYYNNFLSDETLSRRFEGVAIKVPKYSEIFDMIIPRVKKIESKKGISISDKAIHQCIWYAACFEYNKSNPDKSIDVVDRAMANAELEGRNYVTKDDIVNVFRISFEKWNNMDENVRLSTAYHEAGHYVIARIVSRKVYEILAVSIYPTAEYDGINVFEYNDEATPITNRKFFLDNMATDLGGRAAEELVFNDVTSAATVDLYNATEIAKTMTMEYGFCGKIGKNRYYADSDMKIGSGENADKISEEMNNIIDEAYELAKEYLVNNRDYLEAIANALVSHKILMKEELDLIWEHVSKKRNAYKKGKKVVKRIKIMKIFK